MLNRDAIISGAYLESFDSLPREMRWTQAQIDQSRIETMSRRPGHGDVWVFAYGSLMWNPLTQHDERVIATLHKWHRSFCLRMIAGRGTPEFPGRMLALEPGGSTQGVALRLPEQTLDEELRILWVREMVTGVYAPTWAPIILENGEAATALVFVADPQKSRYEPDTSVSVIAPLMHCASGAFGTNAEYVFKLQHALEDCGLNDGYIDEIAAELARLAHTEINLSVRRETGKE